MAERPLLILGAPSTAAKAKKTGRGAASHVPGRDRQAERLGPKLEALQGTLIEAKTEAAGIAPEKVIVLETVGNIPDFLHAVRRIEGLEWLNEIEEVDIPADDDFFVPDKKTGERTEKPMRGRLYLVFSNQKGLAQLLSLWERYKNGEPFEQGTAKWRNLFEHLRDVRLWGLKDRLLDTGVLEDWRERVAHGQEQVSCEVELWYREDPSTRHAAETRVTQLVAALGGEAGRPIAINDIRYHALLASLPIQAIKPLLETASSDLDLVQCEAIQFFRPTGQMGVGVEEGEPEEDVGRVETDRPTADPVIALFDGLPIERHRRLDGRLIVDDPDGLAEGYEASRRRHGTAMASLILHGDLSVGAPALHRPLYVRPILCPDPKDWTGERYERVPEGELVVDLIYRAVKRMFDGDRDEPATARSVAVINLSIGIPDRLFDHSMSPLARLLDWLAWKYKVLFIVSAGNHDRSLELPYGSSEWEALTPVQKQTEILKLVAADARNRRLLSPAESVNALVVGATHRDGCSGDPTGNWIDPYVSAGLPSLLNAQGMGYRRAIKPDVLMPGGRVVLTKAWAQPDPSRSTHLASRPGRQPPGLLVAAPGTVPGDIGKAWYTCGTSNAAALLSRAAGELYEVLEELREEPGGELINAIPRALWLKALLAHGASWGEAGAVLAEILKTPDNAHQLREYLTRLLGYGEVDHTRVIACTERRVTGLGGDHIKVDEGRIHRFPLPPSLSGKRGRRRLTITLAWFTPVNPKHQSWRRADLWFEAPKERLAVKGVEADGRATGRGTLQHEVLEGNAATAFVDGDVLEVLVSCRADGGSLTDPVPYALAVTLEVADEMGVSIYDEVRARVHAARVVVHPHG